MEEANVSHNKISEIRDLCWHRFLKVLDLSNNSITKISGLSQLTKLRKLNLSHNLIGHIEGLDDLPIQNLDLSHNNISAFRNLSTLSHLQYLNVSYNAIQTLDGLQELNSLKELEASHNEIKAVRQAEFLQGLPVLVVLTLSGNPVYTAEHYRQRIILRLQNLTKLDGDDITPQEVIKAINFHGGEGSDLQSRIENHKRLFPDEKFVNTLTPYVEPEADPIGILMPEPNI